MRPLHLSLLLLLSLVGSCFVLAAPAPPSPWMDGWKEVNPDRDCKFVRKGEVLTIEIPKRKESSLQDSPLLFREVAGDFVVQFRVRSGGLQLQTGPAKFTGRAVPPSASAGMVLRFGEDNWAYLGKCWQKNLANRDNTGVDWFVTKEKRIAEKGKETLVSRKLLFRSSRRGLRKDEIYLRLERQGNSLYTAISEDGETWEKMETFAGSLPKSLKMGVFATDPQGQPFKPRFDKFKLTQKAK
jgi:hypothetical protein